MLIDPEEELKVEEIVAAVAGVVGVNLIGQDVIGGQLANAMRISQGGLMSALDDAFLAGKAVQVLGEGKVRAMTLTELREWGKSNIYTARETVALSSLKDDALRWLRGRQEAWRQKFRAVLSNVDKKYTTALGLSGATDAEAQSVLRTLAKKDLFTEVAGISKVMRTDLDKLVQTEMAAFFQQGQAAQMSAEEWVYKIPQPTACEHCLRLHLNPDGSPKLFKLSEVMGLSNQGVPSYLWQFVIGPTHPHCYCILRTVTMYPPQGENAMFASLRKQALNPKKK